MNQDVYKQAYAYAKSQGLTDKQCEEYAESEAEAELDAAIESVIGEDDE